MNQKVIYKNAMFVNLDSTVKLITFQSENDKPIIVSPYKLLYLFVINDSVFLCCHIFRKVLNKYLKIRFVERKSFEWQAKIVL